MVKKKVSKKKVSKKKSVKKKNSPKKSSPVKMEKDIENALVQNFIALQKVMANLSSKFDDLSKQISSLLNLFEISAKALAEKEVKIEKTDKDGKQLTEKLDKILAQNKIIAKALTLVHERFPGETAPQPPMPMPPRMPVPGTQPQVNRNVESQEEGHKDLNMAEYQKSILGKDQNAPKQNFKKL